MTVDVYYGLFNLMLTSCFQDITREDYIKVVEDVTSTFVELITTKDSYWRSYLNPFVNMWLAMNGGSTVRVCLPLDKVVDAC